MANYRCWAEIDLVMLERNLMRIRAALPKPIRYIAVVKANAYGHGMAPVVSRLMHCGADMFAVANLREAAEIQEMGSGWPILLLSPLLPDEDQQLAESGVIVTVSSTEEVERFAKIGQKAERPLEVHLKIDTGMGRLGVWHEDAYRLFAAIQNNPYLNLTGLCTHFSSADIDSAFTEQQRQLFLNILAQCQNKTKSPWLIHADNSASLGSFTSKSPFNAVRIGLMQFGVSPESCTPYLPLKVEPVFSFFTRIGLIKTLPAGASISYQRTCVLKRHSRIALLTAGYGDGIPTTLSGKGEVLIHGCRCPILGRITMDQTIVDITDIAEPHIGDLVTIIGSQRNETISIKDFSRQSRHIPWEVFCSITQRVRRIYRTGERR